MSFVVRCVCLSEGLLDRDSERSRNDHVLVAHTLAHHHGMLVLLLGPRHRLGSYGEGGFAVVFLAGIQGHATPIQGDVHQLDSALR